MKENLKYSNLHGHTDKSSNLRFFDSSIKINEMLDYAKNNNYGAISFTGHESLSDHISAERMYHKNKEYYDNFKLVLGNEIYLIDKNEMEVAEENNYKASEFRFNHFLLNALDKKGHEFLQKQSTLAWKNYHTYHGQQRVPSFYEDIEELMKEYKGHIIASSACLAGTFAECVNKYHKTKDKKYIEKLENFINWCIRVFGKENFKLEIMPSNNPEQKTVNKAVLYFSKQFDIDYIITTDAHYISNKQRPIHDALLHSRDPERDTSAYDTARLFTKEELLDYFDENVIEKALISLETIVSRVEDYSFEHTPDVPLPKESKEVKNDYYVNTPKLQHDLSMYENIEHYMYSESVNDNYLINLIFESLQEKGLISNKEYLARVDLELGELRAISKTLKQPLSSYFLVMREFIKVMWKTSVVGAGRGSSSCYLINYLLGITQVDAIKFKLPYYRFLSKERVTKNTASQFPDIDTDTASSQRENVIDLIKENRGENHVLNFCTFNTIATRSAILTACRGLGIDSTEAQYITSLLPTDNDGKELSINVALNGDKEKDIQPDSKLLNEVNKYENLHDTILGLFGLTIGFSEHASGVYISNPDYTKHNAMMTTKNGIHVTQFDADDSEYASALKYDFLSLDGCDRLQACMQLLLKEDKIKWQGTLYDTYQKYFNTDELDYTNSKMYDMLFSGDIINAFQFSSETGYKTLRKLNARTFEDLISGNALMRLRSNDEEQPLDKYIRFKNDFNQWEDEMDSYGLKTSEKAILHDLLDKYGGICSSQELLMKLSMDVAGFDLVQANALRKAIAKKDPVKQAKQHEVFFKQGKQSGQREEFLEYCWQNCIEIQNGYAFSLPHAIPYTMILITEMNICLRYGLLYWQTACLNVNAKTLSDEIVSPDYPKVAKAIGALKKGTVVHPDINKSKLSFTPDNDKNQILFGLNAINNIGKNEIECILNNRPFETFEDFMNKTNEVIKPKKMVSVIKSGLLNSFGSRRDIMIEYMNEVFKPKKRIGITSAHKFIKDIPEEYHNQINAYAYRKILKSQKLTDKQVFVFVRTISKHIEKYELDNNIQNNSDLWNYDNDKFVVDMKRFNKWLDDYCTPVKDWLKSDDGRLTELNYRKRLFWIENCLGSYATWNMDALNMYTGEHELEIDNYNYKDEAKSFNELAENPPVIGYKKFKNKSFPQYDNCLLAGTVIDKNNNKGIAIVLTPDGVANVRVGRQRFSQYNKKIMKTVNGKRKCVDNSWFERGTKLLCVGHRVQNDFKLNNNGTPYHHTLIKLEGNGNNIREVYSKVEE